MYRLTKKEMITYTIGYKTKEIVEESKKIIADDSYMHWVERFTKLFPSISDFSYGKKNISLEDQQNIDRIKFLFIAVEDYATKNYILEDNKENSHSYNIRFNNQIYKIGYDEDYKGDFYWYYIKKEDFSVNHWIEFTDIQKNEKTYRAKKIDDVIERLGEVLDVLEQEQLDVDNCVFKVLMKRDKIK